MGQPTLGQRLDDDVVSTDVLGGTGRGGGGGGRANKISGTASHLSTLQSGTDERSAGEAARAERVDWRLTGAMGGQLSVIRPGWARGTPVHLYIGLHDPCVGGPEG